MRTPTSASLAKVSGDAAWLRHLDNNDLATFVSELEGALASTAADSTDGLCRLVEDWEVTAEALADPARRAILTDPHRPGDFVEANRPE